MSTSAYWTAESSGRGELTPENDGTTVAYVLLPVTFTSGFSLTLSFCL